MQTWVAVLISSVAVLAAWILANTQTRRSYETVPPAPVQRPPAAAAPAQQDWRVDMLRRINAERQKVGAPALCLNTKLNTAAQAHTADQARRRTMSHTGGDGSSVGTRASRAGYRWTSVGENVARGYGNTAQVMRGWMTSPGHKANLLQRGYRHVGLGRLQGSGGPWWTQVFGTARGETCEAAPAAAPAPAAA